MITLAILAVIGLALALAIVSSLSGATDPTDTTSAWPSEKGYQDGLRQHRNNIRRAIDRRERSRIHGPRPRTTRRR
ncbi:MAG: hypothetical protein OEZ65_17005 [Gemmatimonadota bacterium]|nr:hypothetical protein [Gemmatimonadota bacterium]